MAVSYKHPETRSFLADYVDRLRLSLLQICIYPLGWSVEFPRIRAAMENMLSFASSWVGCM